MKINVGDTDIRKIKDVDDESFVVHNRIAYIVCKKDYKKREVKAFCLWNCRMTEFDFDTQVIYKPNAYISLERKWWEWWK